MNPLSPGKLPARDLGGKLQPHVLRHQGVGRIALGWQNPLQAVVWLPLLG